jgi:hypothetical protein
MILSLPHFRISKKIYFIKVALFFYFTLIMRNKDRNIYDQIRQAKAEKRKLLAILLDPDKIVWENLDHLILKLTNHQLPIFSLAEAS